jgi:transcriptional regulator with XRE-family HTH domain
MKMNNFDLKKFREMINVTQVQLAEMTGTSQEQISRYENKTSTIDIDFFFKLCGLANKSPNELIAACSVAELSLTPIVEPFRIPNVYHQESVKLSTLEHYIKPKLEELAFKETYIEAAGMEKLKSLYQVIQTSNSKPLLGFVGPSDAGKSTLINKLTGIDALLADWTPTTSTTVFVKHKNDKPSWLKEAEYSKTNVIIFRAENDKKSWNYRKLYDRSYCESLMIESGDYEILDEYCNRDSKKKSNEVDSAIVFLEADVLSACDLVDLPGFGTESVEETMKAQRIKEQADMIIFMSQSSSFLNSNDQVTFLKDTIQRLPTINDLPFLDNLIVIASQAHHISDRSKLQSKIRERLSEVINQLDKNVIKHSFNTSKEELVTKLKERFFTYSLDDASLRLDFETEIKRILTEVFPLIWKKRLNRDITQFQGEAVRYFDEEVKKAIAIQEHSEKIRKEYNETKKVLPEKLQEIKRSKEQLLSFAEVSKSNDINSFKVWESTEVTQNYVIELINEKGYDKKQAKEYIGSNLSDAYYSKMQDVLKRSSQEFNNQLTSFFENFERTLGGLGRININETSIPFDFKGALAGGLAGASVLGGLGLWAATVGNLGGYILVAKGVSLLSALGISVGGTAAAASFVAAIGGPITIGIALAALTWLAVSSLIGDGWKKRLAKQVVKLFSDKEVASQYTEGMNNYWNDTKRAIEEVTSSIIKELKDYLDEQEALLNSSDPLLLEQHMYKAIELQRFFDNMPWEDDL